MSERLKEYDRARLEILLHGTDEEKDKLHLYTGSERATAFILGMIAVAPIAFTLFCFAMAWSNKS